VAHPLLDCAAVGHAAIATAAELFEGRHYPSVVALVSDALEEAPESVELLMMRARAHIALRRDLESQADLRDIIRLDPQCGLAYRLLGELAARRDENESAAIFFREALRLDPDDTEAEDWLSIVQISARAIAAPRASSNGARFASGTLSPDPHDADPEDDTEETSRHWAVQPAGIVPAAPAWMPMGSSPLLPSYRDPPTEKREPARPPRSSSRSLVPELPGFGDYLVATGILTRERLRAAQAYQRSMKVQLSTAIVTLGLASPQRIEWAAVAHQSHLARGGH
jgi:tetratricopeptide (TPR) repeat protein